MNAARLFHYKNSPVSYHRFGQGTEILVAFHGYNQTSAEFLYFEDVLSEQFTIIAIDFFWHGQSEWRESEDFTEYDMKMIVMGIKRQEHIEASRFSVCSFSMGARMARALVRSFPSHINYFILLSPPTFAFNRFLNFTTNNPIGLWTFRYFVRNNQSLMNWVKRLNKAGVLNRSVYIFTSKFIGKPDRLEKVFKTWFAQRKLTTNFDSFARLLNEHKIRTILIAGGEDTITPPKRMITYIQNLKLGQVFLISAKHELATVAAKQILAELFQKQNGPAKEKPSL
ncbi:MAG: alpha/beta hydrolase [Bacteroidota bacterium]